MNQNRLIVTNLNVKNGRIVVINHDIQPFDTISDSSQNQSEEQQLE